MSEYNTTVVVVIHKRGDYGYLSEVYRREGDVKADDVQKVADGVSKLITAYTDPDGPA